MIALRALAAFSLAAGLAGCVTEDPPRRATNAPQRPSAEAPSGPVARPATTARTINSRVVVGVQPLGGVPFDGQVLPLVSPDARFLATQVGDAPEWETLLAAPGAGVALRTSVEAYDLTQSPPARIDWPEPLPPGTLLGRSADTRGFLVESPRPDGSRWIGRVNWVTGALTWLVRDANVNAHATLGPHGELLFTRRAPAESRADLVLLTADGRVLERTDDDLNYLTPVFSVSGDTACVFARSGLGLELIALRLGSTGPRLGSLIARRLIARDASALAAYQAVTPVQTPPVHDADGPLADALLFFHPGLGHMALFHAAAGEIIPLAQGSIAAAVRTTSPDHAELFLTTKDGLAHQNVTRDRAGWTAMPASRALADAYVPRRTTDPQRPFILIGPDPDPLRLRLLAMSVVE